jgi:Fe-S-cluster containining protein
MSRRLNQGITKGPNARVDLKLSVVGRPLLFSVDVAAKETSVRSMLPVFRSVCETVVAFAVEAVESDGRQVSCAAGCGACCRQLVPISSTEATMIKDLVSELPEGKREVVTARFREAVERLRNSGLLTQLQNSKQAAGEEFHQLSIDYFRLGIACPFLEDESCSIHPERPLICREYLVVSDPENCSRTNGDPIEAVGLPLSAAKALQKMGNDGRWVPPTLSLTDRDEVAEKNTGANIADRFFNLLIGRELKRLELKRSRQPDHTQMLR